MLYRSSTFLVYWFLKLFFGLSIIGRDAIPCKGSFILASNHLSNFDPPLLAASCPRQIGFLAKEELFHNRSFRFYLHRVGAIPLQREKADITAIRLALRILKQKPLLVFPQGTRGADFNQSRAGVGFLAKKAGVPVVAAKIRGTDKALPKGAKRFRRVKISVSFARVNSITPEDTYEIATAKVLATIQSL